MSIKKRLGLYVLIGSGLGMIINLFLWFTNREFEKVSAELAKTYDEVADGSYDWKKSRSNRNLIAQKPETSPNDQPSLAQEDISIVPVEFTKLATPSPTITPRRAITPRSEATPAPITQGR